MHKRLQVIRDKKARGQPVSFTDFFGYLIGDTVLKEVSFLPYVSWMLVLGSISGKFKLPTYPCRDKRAWSGFHTSQKAQLGICKSNFGKNIENSFLVAVIFSLSPP